LTNHQKQFISYLSISWGCQTG